MRLSRTDLVPALAIIGGGAVCVLTSGVLLLSSRAENASVRAPVVVPANPGAAVVVRRLSEGQRPGGVEESRGEARREGPVLHLVLTAGDEAVAQVEELQRQQREMVRDVRSLAADPRARSYDQIELLRQRKDEMDGAVQDLKLAMEHSASLGQVGDPDAVRSLAVIMNRAVRMQERAAELIGASKLSGELLFSRGTVEQWDLPSAVTLELNIEADLQALRDQLDATQEPAEPIDPDISVRPIPVSGGARLVRFGISAEPVFTPFTVAPTILNEEVVQRAMIRGYPRLLRDAGIGGTVRVYFFIDEQGRVQDFRVDQTSGHQALDDAALAVADVFRFSPALNRDKPVPVWVSFQITFQVR